MNAFSRVTEVIGWVVENFSIGLQAILEFNFSTVAFLLNASYSVADTVTYAFVCTFDVSKSYYLDFLSFSNELALGIQFIFTVIINFISRRVLQLCSFVCCITDLIITLYVEIVNVLNSGVSFLYRMMDTFIYFATLICDAILLILQLGPNLLIFFYENLVYCSKQSWFTLQYTFFYVLENVCNFITDFQNAVLDVPLKAYFGVLLLICFFYTYKIIYECFNACVSFYIRLLLGLMEFTLWLIVKCIIYVRSCYFKGLNYVDSTWPTSSPETYAVQTHLRTSRFQSVYKYIRTMVQSLSIPFLKIKHELDEAQLQQLQKELSAEKERRVCVICQDRERNIILFPCRHMCMCEECTVTLQASYQGCPLCRHDILNTLHVYT